MVPFGGLRVTMGEPVMVSLSNLESRLLTAGMTAKK